MSMTYEELKTVLAQHGIDIERDGISLGIDYADCGERFTRIKQGYVRISKGDKDNGRIMQIYDTEEEYVTAMLSHMKSYYRRKDPDKSALFARLLQETVEVKQ